MRWGRRGGWAPSRAAAIRSLALLGLVAACGCRQHVPTPAAPPAPASPGYRDRAAEAGLRFSWKRNLRRAWTNQDSFGAGCAFLDYDQDGFMDVLLVGQPKCALFRNDGRGAFTDVSDRLGLAGGAEWHGVAVGDYDNDGYPDVYLAGYHAAALLHNERGQRFTDRTGDAGLREREWGSCCAFFDADGDGRLDLVVGHYVKNGPPFPTYCAARGGAKTGCRPAVYPAQFPRLYRNRGDGAFQDVTAASGLKTARGKALALQFADYDNDGKTDFYIANDGTLADMFHNLGGGRFENVSVQVGTSAGMAGEAQAGMGVDFADYDNNGWLDLVVSNWRGETFSLYRNDGFSFEIVSRQAGLATTSAFLGFGLKFLDYDNDGWSDLVFTNGHVYDNVENTDEGGSFRQQLLLFHNERGQFARVEDPGPGFANPIVGRGLAVGDVENTGSPQILAVDYDGAPLLLRAERHAAGKHWLGLQLTGGGRCNRDGYGARVTVSTPEGERFQDCSPYGSYLSCSDPRLLFGLASHPGPVSVTVRWPDGEITRKTVREVDRYVRVSRDPGGPGS